MRDSLAIVKRVIEEHQVIRGHIKLVGDSVADQESLNAISKVRSDWIPGRGGDPAEKRDKLRQAVGYLEGGLVNHFAFEEKALPPLLGELFMRALVIEHQEVKRGIERVKELIVGVELEGLDRDGLMAKESGIQQAVAGLCRLVEEHALREETLLEMLRKALEDKKETGAGEGV